MSQLLVAGWDMHIVLIVAKCSINVFFIVLVLYPPIVLIETDCKIDISIFNFKFLYICLTTFSFFPVKWYNI